MPSGARHIMKRKLIKNPINTLHNISSILILIENINKKRIIPHEARKEKLPLFTITNIR